MTLSDPDAPHLLREQRGQTLWLTIAREERRNADNHHRFRQSSDFLYLTGMTEPESVAVFTPGKDRRFTLLCRPRDKFAELWYGHRAGLEGATELIDIDMALPVATRILRSLNLTVS